MAQTQTIYVIELHTLHGGEHHYTKSFCFADEQQAWSFKDHMEANKSIRELWSGPSPSYVYEHEDDAAFDYYRGEDK
jgi:hypothetical protein